MDKLKDKKVLLLTTTDNMIWQFLIPHARFMQEHGATVECACAKTGFWFDELAKMGFVMHEIPFTRSPFSIKNLKGYKQLKKIVKENDINLIHCHQPVGGAMGRFAAKKFKIPCIYTAHGFHFFKGAPLKNRIIFKTIEKYCSKFTTALVTMNNEDFENASKMKAKKAYQINGIGLDLKKYKKTEDFDKVTFKEELGVQKDEFVIVTVAEFIKRKNYATMLETIKELGDKNIKFLICGRGQQEQEIKNIIERDNLQEKVTILGYRKDVDKILQISDCFFLPSFQEGLTLSIIEAMTFGLPVITSTARGNRDLITDGVNGFVADPRDYKTFANKISILMDDKNLQKEMSKANKKDCQNYDISIVIEQMKKVYEESL